MFPALTAGIISSLEAAVAQRGQPGKVTVKCVSIFIYRHTVSIFKIKSLPRASTLLRCCKSDLHRATCVNTPGECDVTPPLPGCAVTQVLLSRRHKDVIYVLLLTLPGEGQPPPPARHRRSNRESPALVRFVKFKAAVAVPVMTDPEELSFMEKRRAERCLSGPGCAGSRL